MARLPSSVFPLNPDPVEIAWAAGLFEGEGCITWDKRQQRLGFTMQMIDLDVMQKFCRIVGGHEPRLVAPSKNRFPNAKPLYRWAASGTTYVTAFTAAIGPHLCQRRRTALDI